MIQSYINLPKRQRSDKTFKGHQQRYFYSNYFKIHFNPKKTIIYQYDYKLAEGSTEIEKNSQLYSRVIKEIKQDLVKTLGYQMHRGQIVYGSKDQPKTTTHMIEIKSDNGEPQRLDAVFKKVKQINLKDLSFENEPQKNEYILQLLNIKLKNKAKAANMIELGKTGKYFEKDPKIFTIVDERKQKRQQLQAMRGFKFNIVPLNKGYSLLIDVCSRVMQWQTFKDVIKYQKLSPQELNKLYKGQTVTARYGNFSNYSIIQIDYNLTPNSKFVLNSGLQISYKDYYLKHHQIKINDLKQPLIKVLLRTQKITQARVIKKRQVYGYLVPELVSLAGINEYQKSQQSIMRNLSNVTKMNPNKRMQLCQEIKNSLNKQNDFIKIGDAIKLEGMVLQQPKIKYAEERQPVKPDKKGNIRQPGKQWKLRQTAQFKKNQYLFVYSIGQNPDKDDYQADIVIDNLKKSSQAYGVKFQNPAFLTIKNTKTVDKWIEIIQNECQRNGTPSIIILFLNKREQSYYKKLKPFVINELQCASQGIRRKTFENQKARRSAASKLTIQMSVKVGMVAWKVPRNHPYFKEKRNLNLMYCGITSSKNKNGTYLSLVGTTNNECSRFYSQCRKVTKNGLISKQEMEATLTQWARNYFITQKKSPDFIIIYRQGQNQLQAKRQIANCDIPALENTIEKIMKNAKSSTRPRYIIINVNKRISSKFFEINGEEKDNPDSGSFVIEDFATSTSFNLAAQYVTQGTCTPTKFTILHDKSDISNQALITFTYQQCFNYVNWQGAVRVPAALQYANKLAKLRQNINEDITSTGMNKILFYL